MMPRQLTILRIVSFWLAAIGIAVALVHPAWSPAALSAPAANAASEAAETVNEISPDPAPQQGFAQLLDELRDAGFSQKSETIARIADLNNP